MPRELGPHPGTFEPLVLAPGMVSLDWLTLNLTAPERLGFASLPWEAPEPRRWDYELDPDPVNWHAYLTCASELRTPIFGRVSYLTDLQGEKLVTVLSAPHNPKMHDPRWIQVTFSNRTLYSGEWQNLFRMFRAIGCEYDSIGRVDVACDGIEGDGGEWPQVLTMAQRGEAKYYGKCEWLQRSERARVIGGEFGSRSSNKFVRAYRKKREMKSKGVKPHIVEAWKNAFGFDPMAEDDCEVNRFEVQLKGKEIRRYFPNESNADWVLGLANVHRRVDVFASMAPGMFDFRIPAERARDAEPVAVWDWTRVDASPNLAARAKRNLALSEHTIKTGLRAMFHLAHTLSDPNGIAACEQYARASGQPFVDWFERKRYQWVREFNRIEAAKDPRTLDVLQRLREAAANGSE